MGIETEGDSVSIQIARDKLRSVFGFVDFRQNQETAVAALLSGRDAFVVMPTGGGKSLCYQLPALLMKGTAILVSPLIALMKDQVDAAGELGIRAEFLNSTLESHERSLVMERVAAGEVDILYIAPERLADTTFVDFLSGQSPAFFAIDEAHCISEWGHDFRPDYLRLADLVSRFPQTPVAAFTATATQAVQEDILSKLGLRNPVVTRASFDRPNLRFRVVEKNKVEKQILEYVASRPKQAGIVYRATRKSVDRTTAGLTAAGIPVRGYHAGLSPDERRQNQDAFRRDETQIIVATVAFGMGIDKPNVRYVLHGDMPKSLENYYQEAGRAGRDGEAAECTLLYGAGDIRTARYFINSMSDADQAGRARRSLSTIIRYATTLSCRNNALLAYFGEETGPTGCGRCDVCQGEVEAEEATVAAQKVLSAVYRTGGRFGAQHIGHVLLGEPTAMVTKHGHDRLPTFGVASDSDPKHVRSVIDNLVAQEVLRQESGRFATLSLTERARPILRGEQRFFIPKRKRPIGRGATSTGDSQPSIFADGFSPQPGDVELYERLKKLRRELAALSAVPAYLVFPDRTLKEMVRVKPTTRALLTTIHGVGARKLERYGDAFLALLESDATHHDR